MRLTITQNLPNGFSDFQVADIHHFFKGPTLFCISSKNNKAPLYLSCLIHGNEVTGLLSLQELVRQYGCGNWPRPVFAFVGNVEAARHGKRHLDNRPDFNRIWKPGDLHEHRVAAEVLDFLKDKNLFAAIDIHNNTGRNPHYSVVCKKDLRDLNLAALFDRQAMFIDSPIGSKTQSMARLCPALTLEAGLPGKADGTRHVVDFINMVLHLEEIPQKPLSQLGLKVFEILACLKVLPKDSIGVGQDQADLVFMDDLDQYNFSKIPSGTKIGQYKNSHRLLINNLEGHEIKDDFFVYAPDGQIVTKTEICPAMITLDKAIIKSDCLGYLMQDCPLT